MTQNQINRTSDTLFATTFDTNVEAAGVTLVGTTLSADGTDGNINVNVNPKGTGYLATTKAGTVTATEDFFVITNTGNAASMTGTGTAILFNQYYNDGTPAAAACAKISALTEGNWTAALGTRNSALSFSPVFEGVVTERLSLSSAGLLSGRRFEFIDDQTGFHTPFVLKQNTDPGNGAITTNISTSVSSLYLRAYGSTVTAPLGSSCALLLESGNSLNIGTSVASPIYFYTNADFTNPVMKISETARVSIGAGTATAETKLEVAESGVYQVVTDSFSITNNSQTAVMVGTGSAMIFRQAYYDATSPGVVTAGRLGYVTELNWNIFPGSRDNAFFVQVSKEGNLIERLRITSDGKVGIDHNDPITKLGIYTDGIVAANEDVLSIVNRANAASMTGTGSSLVFYQFYHDATPAAGTCARISALTEGNWTAALGTRNSRISFQPVVSGNLTERASLGSDGIFSMFRLDSEGTGQIDNLRFTNTALGNIIQSSNARSPSTFLGIGFAGYLTDDFRMYLNSDGHLALGRTFNTPSSYFDMQFAGTVAANTNFVELTNTGNAAAMTATGTGILWRQTAYDAATPEQYDSTKILSITEGNWTVASAASRNSALALHTSLNGNVAEKVRIKSSGYTGILVTDPQRPLHVATNADGLFRLGNNTRDVFMEFSTAAAGTPDVPMGVTNDGGWPNFYIYSNGKFSVTGTSNIIQLGINKKPEYTLDILRQGTAAANLDIGSFTNSRSAAAMTATATSILWRQFAYDATTPAVYDSARVTSTTEGSWTVASAATRNSALVFQTSREGAVSERTRITSVGGRVYTPTATQDIVAATGITAAMLAYIIRVQGDGGAVTITATPSIVAGLDGQVVIFQGMSDANTVTFQDESSLAGSKLQLAGGADFTLGLYDTLMLMYDANLGYYIEINRSNN